MIWRVAKRRQSTVSRDWIVSLSSSSSSSSSSSRSSSLDSDVICAISLVLSRYVAPRRKRFRRGRIGSVRGRASDRSDLRFKAEGKIDQNVFCRFTPGPPAANETRFKQTFHMPRGTNDYCRSVSLLADADFFGDTVDAIGVKSCTTDQKLCAASMLIVDGVASSKLWPYLKIGNSTTSLCRNRLLTQSSGH